MVVSLKFPQKDDGFPRPHPVPEHEPDRHARRPSTKRLRLLYAAFSVILVAGVGYGAYRFFPHGVASGSTPFTAGEDASTEQERASAAREVQDAVARVGRHIVLPEGETPTVATVTDPSKLAEQSFFAKAKKGDIVLLYTQAKRAYLYDPASDKLVEVAPITTDPR